MLDSPLDQAIAILSGRQTPCPIIMALMLGMDERDKEKALLRLRTFAGEWPNPHGEVRESATICPGENCDKCKNYCEEEVKNTG